MRILVLALASAALSLALSSPAPSASAPAKGPAKGALKASTGDPVPSFGPRPAWAEGVAVPAADPQRKGDPFQFLLSNSQEYLTAAGVENFVEYVVEPLNEVGLQAIGNVTISWNSDRTELTVNNVTIERHGKSIDALKHDDLSVIRRETKLDESTLTGIRTVVLPVRGLQVGDKLRVSVTYKTRPNMIGKTEDIQDMSSPVAIARVVRRLVVSKDLPVRWSVDPSVKAGAEKISGSTVERVFTSENAAPPKKRSFVPKRFSSQLIQVSAYKNWDDVAAAMTPLFDAARKTAANSEVTALADKIAAQHKDPRARLLAALKIAQNEVRYVALLLGDGDYKPMSADDVWAQRYGDCKGKTAFLLALLDRLGIAAEPVLASTVYDDGISARLPTLAMFDHVYVRARVGGEAYYLDGTQFGQRTIDEIKQGSTVHILPLVANTSLAKIPDLQPAAPLIETSLVWDARGGVTEKVPFEATLTLRGSAAAEMRALAAGSSDRDKLIEKYKDRVNGVANDDLEFVSAEPEAADGNYVVKFKGSVLLDWTPVDGKKGNRVELTQSTLVWDADFDRADDGGKTIPVALGFPYWERTIEKFMLPEGGKDFTLDASAIDQTVAATKISRSVGMSEGVVTSVTDFKRLHREIDGATAHAAEAALDKIAEDFGYVVSRKKLKLPKS